MSSTNGTDKLMELQRQIYDEVNHKINGLYGCDPDIDPSQFMVTLDGDYSLTDLLWLVKYLDGKRGEI